MAKEDKSLEDKRKHSMDSISRELWKMSNILIKKPHDIVIFQDSDISPNDKTLFLTKEENQTISAL